MQGAERDAERCRGDGWRDGERKRWRGGEVKRKRQRGRDREEETERKKVSERATEGGESEEGGGAPLKRGEARVVAEALPEGVHLRRRRGRGGVGTAGAGAGRRRGPSWVGDAQGHEGPSTRCTNVDVTKNATVREMSGRRLAGRRRRRTGRRGSGRDRGVSGEVAGLRQRDVSS